MPELDCLVLSIDPSKLKDVGDPACQVIGCTCLQHLEALPTSVRQSGSSKPCFEFTQRTWPMEGLKSDAEEHGYIENSIVMI